MAFVVRVDLRVGQQADEVNDDCRDDRAEQRRQLWAEATDPS